VRKSCGVTWICCNDYHELRIELIKKASKGYLMSGLIASKLISNVIRNGLCCSTSRLTICESPFWQGTDHVTSGCNAFFINEVAGSNLARGESIIHCPKGSRAFPWSLQVNPPYSNSTLNKAAAAYLHVLSDPLFAANRTGRNTWHGNQLSTSGPNDPDSKIIARFPQLLIDTGLKVNNSDTATVSACPW
jgi:hypothetical protein